MIFDRFRSPRGLPKTHSFFTNELPKILVAKDGLNRSVIDEREIQLLRLENGFEVLVVHDDKIKSAGCSVAVNAGYFDDPDDIPGLAHLLEHMIIVGGNQKYREVQSFDKFVSDAAGSKNAYTTAQETNFHFSVPYNSHEVFVEALDRFASSFVGPLFRAEEIDNEAKVVDNEYSKNIGVWLRQISELLRQTSNPNYPYSKFSCGNYRTLSEIPREKGINLHENLEHFFNRHYSANRMKAVIVAPCGIQELRRLAQTLFTRVLNTESVPAEFPSRPFTNAEMPRHFEVVSRTNQRDIILSWPMEDIQNFQVELPHIYLTEAFHSTDKGTIGIALKEQGWVKKIQAFPMQCTNNCTLLWMIISCTEIGINEHHDDIVQSIFSYISLIKEKGLSDEFIALQARRYAITHAQSYQRDPLEFSKSVASNMTCVNTPYILTKDKMSYRFNQTNFDKLLECIAPDRVQVLTVHKGAEVEATEIEDIYGAHYCMERIPNNTLNKWRQMIPSSKLVLKLPGEEQNTRPRSKSCTSAIRSMVSPAQSEPAPRRIEILPFVPPVAVDPTDVPGMPNSLLKLTPNSQEIFVFFPKKKRNPSMALQRSNEAGNGGNANSDDPVKEEQFFIKLYGMMPEFSIIALPNLCERSSALEEKFQIYSTSLKEESHFVKALRDCSEQPDEPLAGQGGGQNGGGELSNIQQALRQMNPEEVKAFLEELAQTQVGTLGDMELNRVWSPLPESWRRPVLIKATSKCLLWFKQNREFRTPEIKVVLFIHEPGLFDLDKCETNTFIRVNFYILFLRDTLAAYKEQCEEELNASFDIFPTDTCIGLRFTGLDEKLLLVIKTVLQTMQRPEELNYTKLRQYKQELLDKASSADSSPLEFAAKNMEFLTQEPKWESKDVAQAINEFKFRHIFDLVPKLFRNRNIQLLVMGNIVPQQANAICSMVEKFVQKNGKPNTFPVKYHTQLEYRTQSYYITESPGDDDRNSAYHARFQIQETTEKNRAALLLLGSLMHSPCREYIRTKEAVGYLISSHVDAFALTAGLEFRFQSNRFGPYCMDYKLENFLAGFRKNLEETTPEVLEKAKHGIANQLLSASPSLDHEMVKWISYIFSGGYEFEQLARVTDALFKLKLEDLIEFFNIYIGPEGEKRAKLVSGVLAECHEEVDLQPEFSPSKSNGDVIVVKNPYEFKHDHALIFSSH